MSGSISGRQVRWLLFCCAFFEGTATFWVAGAEGNILEMCVGAALRGAVLAAMVAICQFFLAKKGNGFSHGGRYALAAYFILALCRLTAGAVGMFCAVLRQERGTVLYLYLFAGVTVYGAFLGREALGRCALPVFWGTLVVFTVAYFVSNLPQMNLQNLAFPVWGGRGAFAYSLSAFPTPAPFLAALLLWPKPEEGGRAARQGIGLFTAFCILLLLFCQLTLGRFFEQSTMPLQTMLQAGTFFGALQLDALGCLALLLCGLLEGGLLGQALLALLWPVRASLPKKGALTIAGIVGTLAQLPLFWGDADGNAFLTAVMFLLLVAAFFTLEERLLIKE